MRRMRVAGVLAGLVLLVGCSQGGDQAGEESPSASPVSASDTASPSPSPELTPSTTASATESASPTPADGPAPGDQLVAEQDGLGLVSFGASPDDTIAAVSARLGEPDDDSGWQPIGSVYGVCPGTRTRVVTWGDLTTVYSDGGTSYAAEGQEHFFTYRIAAQDPAGAAGQSPLTSDGIGIGSTRAELEEAYGPDSLEFFEANELGGPFWSLYGEGPSLRGTLTDTTAEGLVNSIEAGEGCGE